MTLSDCPFCNLLEEKTRIITEKDKVFVVLSDPRLVAGHTLVIPKRHIEKIKELDRDEVEEIFETLVEVEERLLSLATGCDIRQHYRPFLPQSNIKIDHLHFHLLPRELKDELYEESQKFELDMWQELPEEERARFMKLLG